MRWCDTNCEQCHGARTGLLISIIHDGRTAIQTERNRTLNQSSTSSSDPTAVYHRKQKRLSNQTWQANTFTFDCTHAPICKIITMNRKTDNFIIQGTEFAPKQDKVECIAWDKCWQSVGVLWRRFAAPACICNANKSHMIWKPHKRF